MEKQNKMGVMPVNKLLVSMALPMVISMLVQALYNVVDSIFVARLSEEALTAVSLAFPMQSLMISAATGMGVGINAILSRSLGQKNYERANKSAANGVIIEAAAFVIFFILAFVAVKPFYMLQSGPGEISDMGIKYLTIVMACSFGFFSQITFERLLQSTGNTFYTMFTQGTGAVVNIILDPIMIFGLLGFPKLGVAGAALATVIGQIIAGIIAIVINHKKNEEIHLKLHNFVPDGAIMKNILGVGIPSMIMGSLGSVMTFCLNKILIVFTSTAVAVFGVYFKLQSFIFMPVFGLNNGMVPIVSYNYGARDSERLMKTIKYSMCYAMSIMVLGFAVMQLFPQNLLGMFNASDEMVMMGIKALKIISIHFIFAGMTIVFISVFQALGKGILSMIISCTRQLILLIPAAYLLSRLGDVNIVWWAFPIAEAATVVVSLCIFKKVYSNIIKPLSK